MGSTKGTAAQPSKRGGASQDKRNDRDVGKALRAVYHDAVSEKVPDDLLDLLDKLG